MIHIQQIFISIFLITTLAFFDADAQDTNLIISVDGDLAINSITNFRIVLKSEGYEKKVEANYLPGKLSYDEETTFNQLDSIVLLFDYNEYDLEKHRIYSYNIPLHKSWLNSSYLVLYIYNLNKKKYRKIYNPLNKDVSYTYEIDYPGGGLKRIRKR